MSKCQFPHGLSIRPDGEHELDPCMYSLLEVHTNVTVKVYKCVHCGAIDISWERQDNTEDIEYDDFDVKED